MVRSALVTGASSGIGAEYARQLAARGADLVLVARDHAALETLATTLRSLHRVQVEVLAADLLKPRELAKVEARLRDADRPIGILVNDAGFALPFAFEKNPISEEVRHLRLHVEVPMRLSHAALRSMLARGRGRIINVASVSAYMPRSTYGAAKAWVLSFSRWANGAYAGRGVSVTAVLPGFTHTRFHERAGLPPGQEGVADWMWLEASQVVSESLRDAARGRAVSIPSTRYKVLTALSRLAPSGLVARLASRGR
ncbi:SDR family NAD(P)-dependent oxidoreductase [Microbacterium hominis]|uniref:SDR family NAD(P)-dependent oxidoreductase n=1 Tax=Microbacterium hominis TaxID=162426 RepID=A0A7D4Q315_9MICO|nr:SDR family NAD(P)-dependent oxidoreductase [Microbacterium hominis]QKJ19811.1 SDR family NAD(P)-dependent oxidoreductase [Microbacterium hominis]